MSVFVVDTNVAIAANGRDTHADEQCQLACIEKIEGLVEHGIVAVDDAGLILEEYRRHLYYSGRPGVGDVFFKHVFNSQYGCDRVQRIRVTPSDDDGRGFEELPENEFDPSDRKFLAVAVTRGCCCSERDGQRLGRARGADGRAWGGGRAALSTARLKGGVTGSIALFLETGEFFERTRLAPSCRRTSSTPYWPWSPSIGRDDGVHPYPGRFVGEPVVVTEKLDGGNTLLHGGKVYAAACSGPVKASGWRW